MDKDLFYFQGNGKYLFFGQDLKLMHLMMYIISQYFNFFFFNVLILTSYTQSDVPTLNPYNKIDIMHFIINREDPTPQR
jgi:hypothetical protein